MPKAKSTIKLKLTITEDNCLDTWASLNAFLRTATFEACARLLAREKTGKKRPQQLRRIFSRLNRTRAASERLSLSK